MELYEAARIIEGVLFVTDHPVTLKRLREILSLTGTEAPEVQAIRQWIDELNASYQQARHAVRIQEVAGGFQLVTDPQLAPWLKRALSLPREETLSKAAMETLAIIAYRQPITKAEIEVVRGVDGTATLETLVERQFVRVAGHKETPGRPILYATTAEFLQHFGLKSLEDLPKMDLFPKPMDPVPLTAPRTPSEPPPAPAAPSEVTATTSSSSEEAPPST